ncbi:MAG: 5-formyltetrahydrofolate cyclo-ligase [Lachnospiraceae bacterium]
MNKNNFDNNNIHINCMNKKELREYMGNCRNQLSKEMVCHLSHKICEHVVNSYIFKESKCVCIYQAFRNEVCCDEIMKEAFLQNKHVYVPVTNIQEKTMDFFEIFEHTNWVKGAYDILEPCITDCNLVLKEPALVCMPGICFDKEKHRIGYGGGYYDKYFMLHPVHTKLALCYDFQIVESLPFEEHDILPDYIVTEHGLML